jgi:hypothetical protein
LTGVSKDDANDDEKDRSGTDVETLVAATEWVSTIDLLTVASLVPGTSL